EKAENGKRAQAFKEAFDKGDAKAVASFWTADGVFIDETGKRYKGRDAIEKLYEKVFAARKGGKRTLKVNSLRQATPDVVVEEGTTEVSSENGVPSVGRFSAVLVKKDGEWYFDVVREEEFTPPTKAEHFADLEWIIGDWVGEGEKGQADHVSYSWAENK